MAHAHVLRDSYKKFEKVRVQKQLLGQYRGCAWFKLVVWGWWSIARLYDFVGITFLGLVILKVHDYLASLLEVLLFSCQYQTIVLNLTDLNTHVTCKKLQRKTMLGSIPHQKFSLYHFPTRGRAGVKLGDAWYVSNVSIIFDGFMLLSCQTLHVLYAFYIFLGLTY